MSRVLAAMLGKRRTAPLY